MEKIIIVKHNHRGYVATEDKSIVITGYDKEFGFHMPSTTVKNIREGKARKAEIEYLENLYYAVFVKGVEDLAR